jgi:hypothetical protein
MKTAFISYNTFVTGESNGWKGCSGLHQAMLLQNTTGEYWGMSQIGTNEQWHGESKSIVDPLWGQLKAELPMIDKVIMYIGSIGAERVIELAAENGLTPDRAIFVLCSCNRSNKMRVIRERGFATSQTIECECGGHGTMASIFAAALQGVLPNGSN